MSPVIVATIALYYGEWKLALLVLGVATIGAILKSLLEAAKAAQEVEKKIEELRRQRVENLRSQLNDDRL